MDNQHKGATWLIKELWGFGQVPPEDNALTYAKAIMVCAYGDGGFSAEERAWVVGYFAALDYSEAFLAVLEQYDPVDDAHNFAALVDHLSLTAQPDTRLSLIYDGIRAASADKIIDAGELAAVKRLAALIEVSEETVDDIINAYITEVNAKMARIMLCFPAGMPF